MIGPNNWAMVKCATEGCESPEWLMHWPCEGSEDEIRNGKHFCLACESKKFEEICNADPVRHYPVTLPEVVFEDDDAALMTTAEFKRTIKEISKERR
jgi:hypothetical protein